MNQIYVLDVAHNRDEKNRFVYNISIPFENIVQYDVGTFVAHEYLHKSHNVYIDLVMLQHDIKLHSSLDDT